MVDPQNKKNNNRTNRGENTVHFFGQTALHCAAINGNLKMIKPYKNKNKVV